MARLVTMSKSLNREELFGHVKHGIVIAFLSQYGGGTALSKEALVLTVFESS